MKFETTLVFQPANTVGFHQVEMYKAASDHT